MSAGDMGTDTRSEASTPDLISGSCSFIPGLLCSAELIKVKFGYRRLLAVVARIVCAVEQLQASGVVAIEPAHALVFHGEASQRPNLSNLGRVGNNPDGM